MIWGGLLRESIFWILYSIQRASPPYGLLFEQAPGPRAVSVRWRSAGPTELPDTFMTYWKDCSETVDMEAPTH